MKDIYDLYKDSLKGHKKETIEKYDQQIDEIAASFAPEEWFLVNNGYGGIEYVDGTDICHLPFIKNVGFYPTRKNKDIPTYGELKALSFYIRNKDILEKLGDILISKQQMISTSASSDLAGSETTLAKLLISEEKSEKAIQKIK